MTYPANAETVRDAAIGLEEGLFPEGFSGLVRDYIAQQKADSGVEGILHVNASCPLIRRLASPEFPSARKQAALAVVAYFARLFCARMLNADQAAGDLRAWQRSLDRLLDP